MIVQRLFFRALRLVLSAVSVRHSYLVRLIFGTGTLSVVLVAAGGTEPSTNQTNKAGMRLLGDVMFEKYLAQEVARLSGRFLDSAQTLEEWKSEHPRLRQEFLEMIGLWPLPEKTPLNASVTGIIAGPNFIVEKLHYQSRPGLYVTANLWRPREVKEPLPGVLLFVGHYNRGRNGHKTFMQDQGKWFAQHGYVCLIMDTLARGELPGEHHGLYSNDRWWWIARGYTPAAVECWNAVRGIDYLVSRKEVDPNRIAATGLSGGGAVTFWISAVDDRVKVAAAHSGLTDWESLVTSRILRLHCDCMIPYNTFGWELTTVGALVAPTPFLFVNCDDDLGFPMAGNRRIAERLRKIYGMYGREDAFQDYVTHGPLGAHSYTTDSRMVIFKWLNRHLKGDDGPVTDVEEDRFPEENLRTFPTDEDIPKDVLNYVIDQSFVPVAKESLPASGEFEAWRAKLLKQLRGLSFRTFPERIPPADKAPRPDEYKFVDWERETGVQVWNTESGLLTSSTLHGFKSNEPPGDQPVTLVVINEGESLNELPEWSAAFIGKDEPYAILAPRGVGPATWTREPAHYIERAHLCVGRTIDQGRVWDIASVGRRLNGDGPIRVIGRGQAGVLGAYAALFEPTIREVVAVDPPASHTSGPIFLNVLRVLDIPEALGMLAPRPLTLVNASDPVFKRTKEIYDHAGGILLLK